jgi:hypothetical protein
LIKKIVNLPFKDQTQISGSLIIPEKSTGVIIFAHGSGSTVTSYRNQVLGQALNNNGFATLLFDLLTEGEKQIDGKSENITGKFPGITLNKFNIKLLTQRLIFISGILVDPLELPLRFMLSLLLVTSRS